MAWSVEIELVIPRTAVRIALAGLLLLTAAPDLGSESLVLTTYYPAPTGVHTKVVVTGEGGVDTYLARDTGNVRIGSGSATYKLDVNGNARATGNLLTDGTAVTGATNTGTIAANASGITCTVAAPNTGCTAGTHFAAFFPGVVSKYQVQFSSGTNAAQAFYCCTCPYANCSNL